MTTIILLLQSKADSLMCFRLLWIGCRAPMLIEFCVAIQAELGRTVPVSHPISHPHYLTTPPPHTPCPSQLPTPPPHHTTQPYSASIPRFLTPRDQSTAPSQLPAPSHLPIPPFLGNIAPNQLSGPLPLPLRPRPQAAFRFSPRRPKERPLYLSRCPITSDRGHQRGTRGPLHQRHAGRVIA